MCFETNISDAHMLSVFTIMHSSALNPACHPLESTHFPKQDAVSFFSSAASYLQAAANISSAH